MFPQSLYSENTVGNSYYDLTRLRTAINHYHAAIIKAAKRDYNSKFISYITINSRKFWTSVNNFLIANLLQFFHGMSVSNQSLSFATFFFDKIHKLHTNRLSKANHSSLHIDLPSHPVNLSNFQPDTLDEVSKLLSQSPAPWLWSWSYSYFNSHVTCFSSSSYYQKYYQSIIICWVLSQAI